MNMAMYRDYLVKIKLCYAFANMVLGFVFQQESDPKRCSRLAMDWFDRRRVTLMG